MSDELDLDEIERALRNKPKLGWFLSDHGPDSYLKLEFYSYMDKAEDRAGWNMLFAALPELIALAREALRLKIVVAEKGRLVRALAEHLPEDVKRDIAMNHVWGDQTGVKYE